MNEEENLPRVPLVNSIFLTIPPFAINLRLTLFISGTERNKGHIMGPIRHRL